MSIKSRNFRFILILVTAFILVFYLFSIYTFLILSSYNDFGKFYYSTRLFLEGQNIYTLIPLDDIETMPDSVKALASRDTLHPNLNPPFQTLLFLPFGLLESGISYVVFSIASILFGFASVRLIYNEMRPLMDERFHYLILLIILLFYYPTWATVLLGQISLYLLWFLVFAWVLSRAGKDSLAGILLGVALSIKIFTGVFLIFFIVRRRWNLVAWYIGTFLLCNLIAVLVFGLDTHLEYLRVLQEIYWYSSNWNASFMGFFSRIFGGSENLPLFNYPQLTNFLVYTLSLICLLLLVWFSWPKRNEQIFKYDLAFSMALVVMLLVSPLGWMYYFPLLIIPFSVILGISKIFSRKILIFLGLAWIMTTIPRPLIPAAKIGVADSFLWSGLYFYALLVFLGIIIAIDRLLKNETSESQ